MAILEIMGGLINYLFLVVFVFVGVAFVTLMEQKVLGSLQIRLGPNRVGLIGLLQPFADAVKLGSNASVSPSNSNLQMFILMPLLSLIISVLGWLVSPFSSGGLGFFFSFFFFFCISGAMVYPVMLMGWCSNCKYSEMGGLRCVAQMVSYEVSLVIVLLSLFWVEGTLVVKEVLWAQEGLMNVVLYPVLSIFFLITCLAESGRTPYDFTESESELVSGFNTEYSSEGFVLIFLSEYSSMLFMCLVYVFCFCGGTPYSFGVAVLGAMVVFLFIWIRGTLLRTRYDKLMGLAWKSILPASLFLLGFYLWVGCY